MTDSLGSSTTHPSESDIDTHRLRLQLLGQLGVTRYQLQSPELLSPEMAQWADKGSFALGSLEHSSLEHSRSEQKATISAQAVSPQATQTERPLSKAEKPRQPRDLADLRALVSADNPTADPASTAQVNPSRARKTQPEQQNLSASVAATLANATSKASHFEASVPVSNRAELVNATDKLIVNTSVYNALPDWLWQDILILLGIDQQQVVQIAAQQRLSHTQQARLICLNTPQTAFYASNILGIDATMLAALAADITSEQYWQAKQQLWQLLRTAIVE